MPEGPPLRADSRRNRERILDAAAVVLAREARPALSAIAAEAGVSRATIYRYFTDLDAIRAALLEEVTEIARDVLPNRILADDGSPFTERILETLRDSLPIRTRYSEAMVREPVADAGAVALFSPIVTALLKRAQSDAEIRADVDPALIAAAMLNLCFYVARCVHRDGVPVDDAMTILEAFVRGLEPAPERAVS